MLQVVLIRKLKGRRHLSAGVLSGVMLLHAPPGVHLVEFTAPVQKVGTSPPLPLAGDNQAVAHWAETPTILAAYSPPSVRSVILVPCCFAEVRLATRVVSLLRLLPFATHRARSLRVYPLQSGSDVAFDVLNKIVSQLDSSAADALDALSRRVVARVDPTTAMELLSSSS